MEPCVARKKGSRAILRYGPGTLQIAEAQSVFIQNSKAAFPARGALVSLYLARMEICFERKHLYFRAAVNCYPPRDSSAS
jgi:hypothetical protein